VVDSQKSLSAVVLKNHDVSDVAVRVADCFIEELDSCHVCLSLCAHCLGHFRRVKVFISADYLSVNEWAKDIASSAGGLFDNYSVTDWGI